MSIQIKKAQPQDWQIIQDLIYQLFLDNYQYDSLQDNDWPHSQEGQEYVQKACSDDNHCTFIAFDQEKAIGYLAGEKKYWGYRNIKSAELGDMFINPQYQHQGIGTQLVGEFKKWCHQKGLEYIYVLSFYANQKAINFYQKHGFKPLDFGLEVKI